MINGSAVCFLDGGKLKGRRGEEGKKSKYIFNARQRDKKRPLKRGYLRYLAAAFVPPTLFPDGNKKKQLPKKKNIPTDIHPILPLHASIVSHP